MMFDVIEKMVDNYHVNSDFEGFNLELIKEFSVESDMEENEFLKLDKKQIVDKTFNIIQDTYKRKSEQIVEQSWPIIKDVYENQSGQYENIVIPISDGVKVYNILTNLKQAYDSRCRELLHSIEKAIIILIIEDAWKEHLRELDELKQSVQNASYEQKDPLLIFKFESFELFRSMIEKNNSDIVSILMKGQLPQREPSQLQRAHAPKRLDLSKFETSKRDIYEGGNGKPEDTREPQKAQPIRVEKKIGRNDPCPCGSGKKYKACHGVGAE